MGEKKEENTVKGQRSKVKVPKLKTKKKKNLGEKEIDTIDLIGPTFIIIH